MDDPKYGYMCQIAYDWELGEALGPTKIYSSIDDLKKHHTMYENCGIVKVQIIEVEVVHPAAPWREPDEK